MDRGAVGIIMSISTQQLQVSAFALRIARMLGSLAASRLQARYRRLRDAVGTGEICLHFPLERLKTENQRCFLFGFFLL
jgi:hypothetical protein